MKNNISNIFQGCDHAEGFQKMSWPQCFPIALRLKRSSVLLLVMNTFTGVRVCRVHSHEMPLMGLASTSVSLHSSGLITCGERWRTTTREVDGLAGGPARLQSSIRDTTFLNFLSLGFDHYCLWGKQRKVCHEGGIMEEDVSPKEGLISVWWEFYSKIRLFYIFGVWEVSQSKQLTVKSDFLPWLGCKT